MIKQLLAILCIIFTLLSTPLHANAEVSAQAAILTELTSGRVLYSKNSDARLPMASTTKIMTALVALEKGADRLDETIEISDAAAGVEGSSMYLEKGEKMTLRELLYGLMLPSGNDAAVAIAECIGGSVEDFVSMMNQKAEQLRLTNTHFANPNGLPDENHYSSARDMAKMTEDAMKNEVFAEIVKSKTYKIADEGKAYPRILTNHNKLLKMYEGCIGVKTGFTKAAGRCLVSSAERDGMTLICVTLNAPDDWNDHTNMLNYGFENYKLQKILDSTTPVTTAEVDGAYEAAAPLYPERDFFFPLKDDENVKVTNDAPSHLNAPLTLNQEVGKIRLDGADLSNIEIPIVVRSDIKEISKIKTLGEKLTESIQIFFAEWAGLL